MSIDIIHDVRSAVAFHFIKTTVRNVGVIGDRGPFFNGGAA